MSGGLPVCVQYVQAFGSPILAFGVAAAGFAIAYTQKEIARERFRIDMAKERSNFIRSVIACMERIWDHDFDQKFLEFQDNWHHAIPFFDQSFCNDAAGLVLMARDRRLSWQRIMNNANVVEDMRAYNAHQYQRRVLEEVNPPLQAWLERGKVHLKPIRDFPAGMGETLAPALFLFGLVAVPAIISFAMWCGG